MCVACVVRTRAAGDRGTRQGNSDAQFLRPHGHRHHANDQRLPAVGRGLLSRVGSHRRKRARQHDRQATPSNVVDSRLAGALYHPAGRNPRAERTAAQFLLPHRRANQRDDTAHLQTAGLRSAASIHAHN